MDLAKTYKVDVAKEVAGTWVEMDKTCSLLIARFNNKNYRKELERLQAPYRRQGGRRNKEISEEASNEILCRAMSRTILLGWKGLDVDGKPYLYSEDNCYKLLSDPAYAEFKSHVLELSMDIDHYRQEELEETGKDSAPTSDGK